jgi:NTP pyrophosphatase (non-canonical NTP hydrolase)
MTDTTATPWPAVRALVAWLDASDATTVTPDVSRMLRLMKLSEEVGEVASAVIGVTGQNPRKGVTHGWVDVEDELCDVIVTAMVALATIAPDPEGKFGDHVGAVASRVGLSPEASVDWRTRALLAEMAEAERDRLQATLAKIAESIDPCGPPDVANGYDLCPCDSGSLWPCSTTWAAWLARGLDPDEEVARVMRRVRNELIAASPDW